MNKFVLTCLCLHFFATHAFAAEYVRKILQCRGSAEWDGVSHEIFADVFKPEAGQQYTASFEHADGINSTYANSLTLYFHFDSTFKTDNSLQTHDPRLWLSIPLSELSNRIWRFKKNPKAAFEYPYMVDVSLDKENLKGVLIYEYRNGYPLFSSAELKFKTDLMCANADALIGPNPAGDRTRLIYTDGDSRGSILESAGKEPLAIGKELTTVHDETASLTVEVLSFSHPITVSTISSGSVFRDLNVLLARALPEIPNDARITNVIYNGRSPVYMNETISADRSFASCDINAIFAQALPLPNARKSQFAALTFRLDRSKRCPH